MRLSSSDSIPLGYPALDLPDDSDLLTADGFDKALIGWGGAFNQEATVYDYETCVRILVDEGLSQEEAREHMEFNVVGAYVGDHTPIFVRRYEMTENTPSDLDERTVEFTKIDNGYLVTIWSTPTRQRSFPSIGEAVEYVLEHFEGHLGWRLSVEAVSEVDGA